MPNSTKNDQFDQKMTNLTKKMTNLTKNDQFEKNDQVDKK